MSMKEELEIQKALEADGEKLRGLTGKDHGPRFSPLNCPHCEYDRCFPGFEFGGWIQQDNNGPIVACPLCNPDGSYPHNWRPRKDTIDGRS